ncbi:hypothetical protein C807_00399 [Lachnospiraceae bacterium 28-4]|nr:hypothetical protein C807_00399 [Lachnospiraceae bacterium 28-4]
MMVHFNMSKFLEIFIYNRIDHGYCKMSNYMI